MRRKTFWIAASCILAALGVLPVLSSGAAPTSTEKVIYAFTGGADGAQPMSDLTLDAAGNLYGTTSRGGTGTAACNGGCGTVFELKRSQDRWKEEVLYSFTGGPDSAEPAAGVIFDKAGNLYGTTFGTVFKLTPNSHGGWTESNIYSFTCSESAGCGSYADLVFDAQGNLYGTTKFGGDGNSCAYNGCGAVFELTPQTDNSWTETTIHTFRDTDVGDGAVPSSGAVLDSAGNVYGTTIYGGTGSCRNNSYGYYEGIAEIHRELARVVPKGYRDPIFGCGTIYRATQNSGGNWTETVLYNFARGGGFGIFPSGELFFDDANHLFGVAQAGGDGLGAVFDLQDTRKNGWQQGVLYRFYGNPDGTTPAGRLEMDAKGDLFGVTNYGGTNKIGTVFQLKRLGGGWRESVLHSFAGGTDGLSPQAGLVSDSEGHLFGTTPQGGGSGCYNGMGCGTVYEVTP